MTEQHEWRLYDDGSGAFCIAHHGRACMMSRDEAESMLNEHSKLKRATEELLEVASLRGDNELPHPANDHLLWTARMQDAWDELADALAG